MWNKWTGSFLPALRRHMTNENRSKAGVLGAGCAYIYLNGVWLYYSIQSEGSPSRDRLDGPIPQLFMGDILSHFSPYMLPAYVKGNCLSEIVKRVSSETTELRDRILAYLTLNKILRNAVCVKYLFCGSHDFAPIMEDILSPKELPTGSSEDKTADKDEPELLFNIKISCLEEYFKGIPKENRQVDYNDMVMLIKLARRYPSAKSQERVSKVLLLLLENEENCVTVARKEFEVFESCSLIQDDSSKLSDLVLRFLYSTKQSGPWLLSLLNENQETAVNNALSIDLINQSIKHLGMVLSPVNVTKIKMDGFQTFLSAVEISYAYAFLRSLISRRVPGAEQGHKLKTALMDGLRTTRGVLIYHGIYALQNKVIKSEAYFNNESFMLPMSLVISATSWMALCSLSITHRFFLLPVVIHKISS